MEDSSDLEPLVTVVVPAYNHEKYIEDCLESIIKQTYSNMEIIVLNDGSTDSTENVIKKFINKQNQNIKFISKKNEGLTKTLNKGLKLAKGKYVAFLASDDMWVPNKIEEQVIFMEQNENIGMVFTDAYFIIDGKITGKKYTDYKPIIRKCFLNSIQNANIHKVLLKENIIPAVTALTRKDCYDEIGLLDTTLRFEDYDRWLRLTAKYPIGYIDEPLAYYRIHRNNISNNVRFMLLGVIQTIVKQYEDEPFINRIVKVIAIFIRYLFIALKNRVNKVLKYSK